MTSWVNKSDTDIYAGMRVVERNDVLHAAVALIFSCANVWKIVGNEKTLDGRQEQ